MTDNIIDFDSGKLAFVHKRKEAKVDELRAAFRAARGEKESRAARRRAAKQQKPKLK